MLILANTLEFNGVATFMLRYCRESAKQGRRVAVLVLVNDPEPGLLTELRQYADVHFMSEFMSPLWGFVKTTPLVNFLPIDFNSLDQLFSSYENKVHVMGVFGLLFIARYVKRQRKALKLSVGVYHQNEFMYSKLPYYFASEIQRLVCAIGEKRMIFFNDANTRSYSRFFNIDFKRSTVVPIGIDLPLNNGNQLGAYKSNRIVSIGNLFDFKSYNEHILRCLPYLLKINPCLRYEIYGEGPYFDKLNELAQSLKVDDAVDFKGRIPYNKIRSVLDGAFLFVGSGTAVVEAAAFGVPSLIGIESTSSPITYGFLSEIDGFSYNEYEDGRITYMMADKIVSLMSSHDIWHHFAESCRLKAHSFSMVETIKGFDQNMATSLAVDQTTVGTYSSKRACISLMCCAFMQIVRIDSRFSTRRNQGSIC